MQDYYKVLQVDPNAEPEVIEAAYRRLARKYHPDVNQSADAQARMKDINDAYDTLHDPMKRAEYDRKRTQAGDEAGRRRQEEEARRREQEEARKQEEERLRRQQEEERRRREQAQRQQESTPPKDVRHRARTAGLRRDGDWYLFRIGWAEDFQATLNALKSQVPAQYRTWDTRAKLWRVHSSYEHVLAMLFADFRGGSRADAPQAPRQPAKTAGSPTSDFNWVWILLGLVLFGCLLVFSQGRGEDGLAVTATPTSSPRTVTRTPSPSLTRTRTPTNSPTAPPTATPTTRPTATFWQPCDCSYNRYDCSDFPTHAAAQACYEYCLRIVGWDVHWLDDDNDGSACEWNP